MIVPFQMVMYTLSKTADMFNFNTPYTISIIYLGFGAGLAIFMFTVKEPKFVREMQEESKKYNIIENDNDDSNSGDRK